MTTDLISQRLPDIVGSGTPALSVVLVISGPFLGAVRSLDCLARQTIADRVELILTSDRRENLEAAAPWLSSFAAVQRSVGDVTRLPHLRAAVAMDARAPYVAFAEDHSFVEPTWAAALVAAFESNPLVVAVAPAMVNPNPGHPVSRAQFAAYFGLFARERWNSGLQRVDWLPWHNTAYRRDGLLAIGARDVGGLLEVEGYLQQRLLRERAGSYMLLAADTATHHVNVSRLWPACHHGFLGGMLFAQHRRADLGWSWPRRIVQSMAAPLVPLVRLARNGRMLFALARGPFDGLRLWVTAFIMAAFHASGELVGNLYAPSDLVQRYSWFEFRRARFVRADDVQFLEPASLPSPPAAVRA